MFEDIFLKFHFSNRNALKIKHQREIRITFDGNKKRSGYVKLLSVIRYIYIRLILFKSSESN